MLHCPTCFQRIREFIKLHDDYTYESRIEIADDGILRQTLLGYWRWVAEGKIPHGPAWNVDTKVQYYHDPYHSWMEFDPSSNRYKFAIQTSDSPEGDTWWRGSFRLERMEIVDIIRTKESF